jgi:hypothetical protein
VPVTSGGTWGYYWHQAAYIPDTADHAAAWNVAAGFRELHEDEFTGGFVLLTLIAGT